jgi:pyruvate formate lyase activating enzyme
MESNIRDIAIFLRNLNITEASLLAYNPLWHEKSDKVGVEDPYKKNKAMISFTEKSIVARCKEIFADAGIIEIKN